MKILVNLMAVILLVVGTWLLAIGVAHQSAFLSTPRFVVPLAEVVVEPIKQMPLQNRLTIVGRHGLLPLLGGIGGAILVVGLLLLRWRNPRTVSTRQARSIILPPAVEKDHNPKTTASVPDNTKHLAATQPQDDLDNVQSLEGLSQSPLTKETCHKLLAKFHPELLSFIAQFEEQALLDFTQQVLTCLILQRRADEKNTTPDPRLHEALRETVVRRYMPKVTAELLGEAPTYVGRVFAMAQTDAPNFVSGADDWMDISVRNAQEVLSIRRGDTA